MLNIRIWLFVVIIVVVILLSCGLSYGYRNGNCVLCKVFSKKDIIAKSEEEGELNQDDANTLVSDMVKLGKLLDDGTFELTEGNEEEYEKISNALNKHGYKINYQSIIAVKAS